MAQESVDVKAVCVSRETCMLEKSPRFHVKHPRLWNSLANAEFREDHAKNVFYAMLSGDSAKTETRAAKHFRTQFQRRSLVV